jgi:hypothetical protein
MNRATISYRVSMRFSGILVFGHAGRTSADFEHAKPNHHNSQENLTTLNFSRTSYTLIGLSTEKFFVRSSVDSRVETRHVSALPTLASHLPCAETLTCFVFHAHKAFFPTAAI